MTVTNWPSYLLRRIPADTRTALSERAEQDDVSLADIVRQALCHHYKKDCDHASFHYQAALDNNGDILLVRIQPEIWRLIKKETRGKYGETKRLILSAIDNYLGET